MLRCALPSASARHAAASGGAVGGGALAFARHAAEPSTASHARSAAAVGRARARACERARTASAAERDVAARVVARARHRAGVAARALDDRRVARVEPVADDVARVVGRARDGPVVAGARGAIDAAHVTRETLRACRRTSGRARRRGVGHARGRIAGSGVDSRRRVAPTAPDDRNERGDQRSPRESPEGARSSLPFRGPEAHGCTRRWSRSPSARRAVCMALGSLSNVVASVMKARAVDVANAPSPAMSSAWRYS